MRPTVLAVLALFLLPLVPAEGATSYTVTASNFKWTPSELTIQLGDTVTFTNSGGSHTYADERGVACPLPCTPTFDAVDTITFWCGVHPTTMRGTVTVQGEPPTVSITSPTDGASVAGVITVEGDAAHSTADITKVEVRVDSGAWAPATLSGSGGSVTWAFPLDTTVLANGGHRITARATSSLGSSAETAVDVTVSNPPTMDLTVAALGGKATTFGATVTYTLTNDGNTGTPGFKVRFEYQYKGEWKPITERAHGGLGAFSSTSSSFAWNPLTLVGRFDVRATVDSGDVVAETDETDNQRTGTVPVVTSFVAGRDLRNP